MGTIKKKVIWTVVILIIIGLVFAMTEVFFPRITLAEGSLDGNKLPDILQKYEKDNHYYVSFNDSNGKNELECTKAQYDFMTADIQIYIVYEKNYFNRQKGTILKVDDAPVNRYMIH